jgi:hypothetical protein
MGPLFQEPKTDDKDVQEFHAKVDSNRVRLKALLEQRIHHA